jgi:hypothetical protein
VTPDEVERTIHFLRSHQAQFATDLQQVRELEDRRHTQLTDAVLGLAGILGRLSSLQEALAERHDDLVRRVDQLAEAQRETQANLNALILAVEKYLRDRRNGGSAGSA